MDQFQCSNFFQSDCLLFLIKAIIKKNVLCYTFTFCITQPFAKKVKIKVFTESAPRPIQSSSHNIYYKDEGKNSQTKQKKIHLQKKVCSHLNLTPVKRNCTLIISVTTSMSAPLHPLPPPSPKKTRSVEQVIFLIFLKYQCLQLYHLFITKYSRQDIAQKYKQYFLHISIQCNLLFYTMRVNLNLIQNLKQLVSWYFK